MASIMTKGRQKNEKIRNYVGTWMKLQGLISVDYLPVIRITILCTKLCMSTKHRQVKGTLVNICMYTPRGKWTTLCC